MRFTLRQLEVFAAIGRTGNVTQAADRLAMSQSAASASLAELERQFARPLFDRVGRNLRLNETGRLLLPKALEMLDRATELEGLLAGGTPGPLRLGASVTIGNYLGPLLIERYTGRFPEAPIHLDVDNTSRIAARVAGFDLDLALIEGQYAHPLLTTSAWLGDELAVFCGARHPLARTGRASIEQVLEEPWVVRERGSGTRQTLDRAMGPYWSRWKIALELEHTEAIKRTVEGGRTIGCVSRLALKDAFLSGSLVEITVPELSLERRFYIVLNREKYRTPGIDAFLALCREIAEEGKRSDEIAF